MALAACLMAMCLAAAVLAGCAEKHASGPDAIAEPGPSGPSGLSGLSGLSAPSGGPINARTIHQEVRQAIAALVQAKNARDVRGILACYDVEARVMTWVPDQERDVLAPLAVFRDLLPGKVQGWAEHDRRHELLAVEEPTLHGREIWCVYTVRITEGQGEGAGQVQARFTTRLVHQAGRWLVVEERYSKVE
ncbi:Cif family virulence factor [Megalodesulfovibrio gigas]|nr:hypothetical protein [Megalodesulfovibrio gigas]